MGVSISSITEDQDSKDKVSVSEARVQLSDSFTPLNLINEWKLFAESLAEEQHLKNTMLNCLPDLLDNNIFEVVVNNPVQEQRLMENYVRILNAIKDKLRNTQIEMKIRVSIDNEKKLGFTSLERYNLMAEQNEALRKLKDEFGLEII